MTKSSASISTLLALSAALSACAANAPDGDDYDGGGGGSGGGDGEILPMSAEGKFAMQSTFDVATNMPGTAGAVINGFIDATDSPDDPTHWILDQIVAKLPDGTIKNTLQGAIPFAAGYLNDRLLDVAPDFVTTIRDVGNKFGQVARNFGTLETLEVGANGQATKTVNGVDFKVDNIDLQYMFKDYNMADVTVTGVAVAIDNTGKLTIGDHKVPLSYGKLLRLGLDEVVIPFVDPTAQNLGDVLKHVVNCQKVGQYLYEAIDIGSPSTFQSACDAGLQGGASALYGLLNKVDDSALEFGITGIARGIDNNNDRKMDKIQTGAWSGTLAYGGNGAPLAKGVFIGQRM
jgi:hypothetical protein